MAFSSQHIYSAIRWAFLARMSLLLLSWASTIVVMRLLTPGDYGVMAVAAIFTGLAALLSEAGLNEVIIRKQDPNIAFQRAVIGAVLLINTMLFAVLYTFSGFIASSFAINQLQTIIPVLSLQFIFNALALLPVSLLERKMHYKAMATVDAVSVLCSVSVAITLAYHGYGVWALILSAVVGSVIRYIVASIISRSALLPSWRLNTLHTERRFASAVLLNKLCWYLSSVADDFIIGKLLGKERLGYYAVSKDFALLFQQKTAAIIHQISFPLLSQPISCEQRNQLLLKGCAMLSFIVLPLTAVVCSIAPLLVDVVLGANWIQIGPLLSAMILALPIRVLNNLLGNAVSAAGYPQRRLIVQSINLALIIAFTLAGCLLWQLPGAVAGWLLANVLLLPLMLAFYLPFIQLPSTSLFAALFTNWQAFGLLSLLLVLQHQLDLDALSPLLMLIINLTTALVTYALTSWIFNRAGCISLRKLLQPSYQGNN